MDVDHSTNPSKQDRHLLDKFSYRHIRLQDDMGIKQMTALLKELGEGVAPSPEPAQSQAAQYQALSLALREIALLEASIQKMAESGQQVIPRLANRRSDS